MNLKRILEQITTQKAANKKANTKAAVGAGIGATLGVLAGMLFSPKTGKENRDEVSKVAKKAYDTSKEKVEEGVGFVKEKIEDYKKKECCKGETDCEGK